MLRIVGDDNMDILTGLDRNENAPYVPFLGPRRRPDCAKDLIARWYLFTRALRLSSVCGRWDQEGSAGHQLTIDPTGSTDTLIATWQAAVPGDSPVDQYQIS